MPLNFEGESCVVLDPWWARLLRWPLVLHQLNPSSRKACWIPSALGLIRCAFCSSLWVDDFGFIHRPPKLLHCPDVYYLAFSNDPLTRKTLVYGVYTVELIQTILLSKKAFQELAAGFGSFAALDEGGLLWFAVPILSTTGVFSSFCGHCLSPAYK